jgi:hypothetical protein
MRMGEQMQEAALCGEIALHLMTGRAAPPALARARTRHYSTL